MADVTLSYKGSDILELSDSGSATLKTGGKYCEDDIAVEYVKPSGWGGLTLLASGTYTLANDGAFEIPFQTNGTPLISYVTIAEAISGISQTAGWVSVDVSQIQTEQPTVFDGAITALNIKSDGSRIYSVPIAIGSATNGLYSDKIVLRSTGSSYPVKANDYKWYVWGIA